MAKWGISKRGKRYYNWRDSDGQFTDDGIPNSMGSLVDAATKNLGRDLIKNAGWRQTKAGNLSSGNGRLPSSKIYPAPYSQDQITRTPIGKGGSYTAAPTDPNARMLNGKTRAENDSAIRAAVDNAKEARARATDLEATIPKIRQLIAQADPNSALAADLRKSLANTERLLAKSQANAGSAKAAKAPVAGDKPETWTEKYAREQREGKDNGVADFFKKVDAQYPDDGEDDEDQVNEPKKPETWTQKYAREVAEGKHKEIQDFFKKVDAMYPDNGEDDEDQENEPTKPETWTQKYAREVSEGKHKEIGEFFKRVDAQYPDNGEDDEDQNLPPRANPEGKDARSMTTAEKLEAGRIMFGDKAMAEKAAPVTTQSLARKAPADPKARQEYYNYLATNGTPDQKLAAKQLGGRDTDPRSNAGKPATAGLSPERQRLEAVRKPTAESPRDASRRRRAAEQAEREASERAREGGRMDPYNTSEEERQAFAGVTDRQMGDIREWNNLVGAKKSQYAEAYKKEFGELPSQTRRRIDEGEGPIINQRAADALKPDPRNRSADLTASAPGRENSAMERAANKVGPRSRPAVDYGSDYASMPANQQKTYRSKRRKLIDTAVEAGLPNTEIKRIFSGPMDTWPSAAELKRKR